MNWVDYIIIGIIALSALVGVARGLIREVLSLGTWIAALAIAWLFHQQVAELLSTQLSNPMVRTGVAFMGLVLLVLLVGAILAAVLTTLIDTVGLTGMDRLLGMAFGGARGVVLVAMAVYLVALTPAPSDPAWSQSVLITDFASIGDWLLSLVPPEIEDRLKQI
ncbi:CvpA family protein [Allochromatium palmeri]|uniref:CvpA family protein n=1 Tax=Allochromatium palmeri TaxID=231048 RepID=A0A6N8EER1_9GAMM|nr:CvpA family protein [Allochromatium palmeri]MTW21116.1 CvpA family protein [Allochromatium palmeri]